MSDILSFLGILLALIILIFKRNEYHHLNYLGGFYLLISLLALSKNIIFSGNYFAGFIFYFPITSIFFCTGPFLYLFVKKSLINAKDGFIKKNEYLYFLPVVIVFINFLPQYLISYKEQANFYNEIKINPLYIFKIKYLLFSLKITSIIRPFWNLAFILAAFLLVLKNASITETNRSKYISINFNYSLIILFFIQNLFFLTTTLLIQINKTFKFSDMNSSEILFMNMYSLINFSMCLLVFIFPKMLYGISSLDKVFQFSDTIFNLENPDFRGGEKPLESFKLMSQKLKTYFEGKPFLEKGFSISTISKNTQIPYNQIRLFYQVYLKVSFSDWKNRERINHAKDLFCRGQADKLTIEAIALECGYLSRSNFITSFKKYVGVSPSVFIKNLPKKSY